MTDFDTYIQNTPPSQRKVLLHICEVVKSVAPEAEATISYAIPTFKYKKKNLIHFAAFKDHSSIFPTVKPIDELADQLKKYRTGKGTLQFSEDAPIPDNLIKELVLIRKQSIDG